MLGQNAAPSEGLPGLDPGAPRLFAEGKELKTYGAENEAFLKPLIAGGKHSEAALAGPPAAGPTAPNAARPLAAQLDNPYTLPLRNAALRSW